MIRHEVSISMETYTTVIQKENLGDPHPTLSGGELWYPPDGERDKDRRVSDELREHGLLVNRDRLADGFLDALAVMQRAAVEYYTFASVEGNKATARTAALGRDAVLVVFDGTAIHIEPIPAEQLGVRLAAALPEVPPAHLHSISCDVKDLRAVKGGTSLPSSPSVADAKRMKRFLELERISTGQLFAAIRDGEGGRRATTAPMPCWIDTHEGRALLNPDPGGWLNLAGSGLTEIARVLGDLERRLRR